MEECELCEWCYLCWMCARQKDNNSNKNNNLTITISGMQKQFIHKLYLLNVMFVLEDNVSETIMLCNTTLNKYYGFMLYD